MIVLVVAVEQFMIFNLSDSNKNSLNEPKLGKPNKAIILIILFI